MSIDSLKAKLPDFAKDVRLNLGSLANDESLGTQAKYGLLLACALATRNAEVVEAFDREATPHLSPEARDAARAAATIMAMNNVYYRFVHLTSNPTYRTLPAKLRMSVIGNPGVPKVDFELWCLAVSAINGCGACIDAHEKVLMEAGVTEEAIQTAVRFAAIVQSTAVALEAAALPALA
ncbi:MAG: carboxymuconolactone decarboxylase family protein [Methylocella sp.]